MNVRFNWSIESGQLAAAKRFYDDNGFVIFERVFAPETCDAVNQEYRAIAEPEFPPVLNYDRENVLIREMVMKSPLVVDAVKEML